jgi:hypothetical protein
MLATCQLTQLRRAAALTIPRAASWCTRPAIVAKDRVERRDRAVDVGERVHRRHLHEDVRRTAGTNG